jgi:small-conductance mechanosensitive channel/CRP-like cAMP-binding protein
MVDGAVLQSGGERADGAGLTWDVFERHSMVFMPGRADPFKPCENLTGAPMAADPWRALNTFLEFLHTPPALILAGLLAAVLVMLRFVSADRDLRKDVRGAVFLLLAFLLVRGVERYLGVTSASGAPTALRVGLLLTFSFAIIRTTVSLLLRLFRAHGADIPKILRDVLDFSLYVLVAIPVLKAELNLDLSGIVATSAIASVVLGLALQETLGNLFAGLSIQIERPFRVGDHVQIKEESGQVIQVAWRATRIETGRGELVTVPNSILSKEAVKNFSRSDQPVALDLYFGASTDAPPNYVKQTVLEMFAEIHQVLTDPSPTCRTYAFRDSDIQYRIRAYLAPGNGPGRVRDEILTRLWYRLRRAGIEQPFPQRMLHMIPATTSEEWPLATRLELLRTVNFLSVLDEERLSQLALEMKAHRFGRGERVIAEGAQGQTFYIVAVGEVSVQTGRDRLEVARLRRGQYFGEMSLLTGEPRAATVCATVDAVLFEVDRPTFAQLFIANPDLAKQLSSLLADRRSQLRAVADASGGAEEDPEAGRILNRLKQIFGLTA